MRQLVALLVLASSLALGPVAAAQTPQQLEAVLAEAASQLRAELDLRRLTEAEKDYVITCTLYANEATPEGEPCEAVRVMELMVRPELADGDAPEDEGEGGRDGSDREIGMLDPELASPSGFEDRLALQVTLPAPRYAVAYDPSGAWAVGMAGPMRATLSMRPGLVTSDALAPETRAFLQTLAGRQNLALGTRLAISTDGSGTVRAYGLNAERPQSELEVTTIECERRLERLSDRIDALATAPAPQTVLHPTTCDWLLIAEGQAEAGTDAWNGLASSVQRQLDAGKPVAVAVTPDGRDYAVVTTGGVARSGRIPYSFEETVRSAQIDRFDITGRGVLEPVGEVHALAFHPKHFAVGPDGVTGWVLVGETGYRARGVEAAVCDAIEAVTGFDPGAMRDAVCADAIGGAAPFALHPDRNKLVVLVHGITQAPRQAPALSIGQPGHSRYYWGYELVSGLVGHPYDGSPSHDLIASGRSAPGTDGRRLSVRHTVTPDTWHLCGAADADAPCASSVMSSRYDPAVAPAYAAGSLDVPWLSARRSGAPWTAATLLYRDGSQHLDRQLAATIDQLYTTYQAHFGPLEAAEQPQMYLVGHSFGGVVSRALATPQDGPDGLALTAEQRQRAAFLRDRIVLITTLSTPHLGSPSTTFTNELQTMLDGVQREMNVHLRRSPVSAPADYVRAATEGFTFAANEISAFREVYTAIDAMDVLNRTTLAPDRAVRSDGSAIPVYTASGRNPGGMFFWVPKRLLSTQQDLLTVAGSGRHGKEAAAQLVIDMLMQHFGVGAGPCTPWGRAAEPEGDRMTAPRFCPSSHLLDRMGNRTDALLADADELVSHLATTPEGYGLSPDGVYDSDGLVGFGSGHAIGLATTSWYRLYDRAYGTQMPWDVDNHGSLMFNPGTGLWIYDRLVQAAGPRATPGLWSTWGATTPPVASSTRTITVSIGELAELSGVDDGGLEPDGAEFRLVVQIGDEVFGPPTLPGNMRTLRFGAPSTNADGDRVTQGLLIYEHRTPGTVVPIRFTLRDMDTLSPDDDIVLAPKPGRESLFVYYDTRTGRVYGDVHGRAGEWIEVTGYRRAGGQDLDYGRIRFSVIEN